ncbi:MAG TPA: hypothetical protein VMU85_06275 [Stellaceae bacterium]|nr:hypothetical protein [Stellaceae bacterium]
MIGNNAADNAASVKGAGPGLAAASSLDRPAPASAPVIDLAERTRAPRIGIRVHWGLLFAVGASLALWLLIWACVRLFF